MKKMIWDLISLTLAAILFTGCSIGNTASSTPETSGSAVSENLMNKKETSGGAVGEDAPHRDSQNQETAAHPEQVGGHYRNDDYEYVRDRYGDALVQYDLKGNLVKTIPMDNDGVQWVTNEWLYYISADDGGLWRIPIVKTKKGDHLKTEKKERLLKESENNYNIAYMTDSYFLVELWNDEGQTICKYDLESGKLSELMGSKELGEAFEFYDDEQGNPIMLNGDLIFEGEKELFCLNPESGESKAIYSVGKTGIMSYEKSGSVLYLLLDNAFYQYDSISKKISCLISKESFFKEVDKLGLGIMMYPKVTEMYLEKGTMYFLLKVEWYRKGKKVFTKKMNYLVPRRVIS